MPGASRPNGCLSDLRREGASDEELALLSEAAREVRRLDAAFRPYLPSVVTQGIRGDAPDVARLGGEEREVSVVFADLAGFTTFSETRSPTEVIGMLNEYWGAVVPVIDAAGGVIEHFAGDGVMAIFNAGGDQPDHAERAARTRPLPSSRRESRSPRPIPDGRSSGSGSTPGRRSSGTSARTRGGASPRSVTAINTAARLMAAGEPGQVVIGKATWDALGDDRAGEPLGAVRVKGKSDPVEAWRLEDLVARIDVDAVQGSPMDQLGSLQSVGVPGTSWLPRHANASRARVSPELPRTPMYTCAPGKVRRRLANPSSLIKQPIRLGISSSPGV